MNITLPSLPFEKDALEPVISERTLGHHYDKHHAGYVKKLKDALENSDRYETLEEIISDSFNNQNAKVFNSAAQVWNHSFYWNSLSPKDSEPDKALSELIKQSFGDMGSLLAELKDTAAAEFGSGWAWLLYDPANDSLSIESTTDAQTPITGKLIPLLTIDVWEHAYYLDYQQDRAAYLNGVTTKLLNWDFANENLKNANTSAKAA
ncbi:MAG: superoxide dismutase [Nitrospirales bacterium]|nr:MAG: superoxide dismutase [Nitrospirales bacterium]